MLRRFASITSLLHRKLQAARFICSVRRLAALHPSSTARGEPKTNSMEPSASLSLAITGGIIIIDGIIIVGVVFIIGGDVVVVGSAIIGGGARKA